MPKRKGEVICMTSVLWCIYDCIIWCIWHYRPTLAPQPCILCIWHIKTPYWAMQPTMPLYMEYMAFPDPTSGPNSPVRAIYATLIHVIVFTTLFYNSFKSDHDCEQYLPYLDDPNQKKLFTKFRISNHSLMTETGRYTAQKHQGKIENV